MKEMWDYENGMLGPAKRKRRLQSITKRINYTTDIPDCEL